MSVSINDFLKEVNAAGYLATLDQKNINAGMTAKESKDCMKINEQWMKTCRNSIERIKNSRPTTAFYDEGTQQWVHSLHLRTLELLSLSPKEVSIELATETLPYSTAQANVVASQVNRASVPQIASALEGKFLLKLYDEIRWFGV